MQWDLPIGRPLIQCVIRFVLRPAGLDEIEWYVRIGKKGKGLMAQYRRKEGFEGEIGSRLFLQLILA